MHFLNADCSKWNFPVWNKQEEISYMHLYFFKVREGKISWNVDAMLPSIFWIIFFVVAIPLLELITSVLTTRIWVFQEKKHDLFYNLMINL